MIILIRLSDNKTFQKVLKLLFVNKGTFVGNIKFIKNKKYQKTILLLLEKFFLPFNDAKSLNTTENSYIANRNKVFDRVIDPIDSAIEKFKNPGSVLIIKDRISLEN